VNQIEVRVKHHLQQVMAWMTRKVVVAAEVGATSPSYQFVAKTETFYQALGVGRDLRPEVLKASLQKACVAFSMATVTGLANLSPMTTLCCVENSWEDWTLVM
jgi:hypothetical protein